MKVAQYKVVHQKNPINILVFCCCGSVDKPWHVITKYMKLNDLPKPDRGARNTKHKFWLKVPDRLSEGARSTIKYF